MLVYPVKLMDGRGKRLDTALTAASTCVKDAMMSRRHVLIDEGKMADLEIAGMTKNKGSERCPLHPDELVNYHCPIAPPTHSLAVIFVVLRTINHVQTFSIYRRPFKE